MGRTRKLDIDTVLNVLALHDNEVSKAAKTLVVERATIYSLLAVHGYEIGKVVRKIKGAKK
jgi:hypothetical protein